MKKVVYSIRKMGNSECRWTGVGYLSEGDLMIPAISKSGKAYIRVFFGAEKHCHPIMYKDNEFKGVYYEVIDAELDTGKDSYETREIELNYNIWYKYVD